MGFTEKDILPLIQSDCWMMSVLKAAQSLQLPDWMIGAGFIRNRIWDHLHGFESKTVHTNDIDLIYYDSAGVDESQEKEYDRQLGELMDIEWSAKNQARMHLMHNLAEPYTSTEHALSEWIETPTCIAVRLDADNSLRLFAPHGTDDLLNLVVRPTPAACNRLDVFHERIRSKGWLERWYKLRIIL